MRAVALATLLLVATALAPVASAGVSFVGRLGATPGDEGDTPQCAMDPPIYGDDGRGDPYICVLGFYVPDVCLAFCDLPSCDTPYCHFPPQPVVDIVDLAQGTVVGQDFICAGGQPVPVTCLDLGVDCQVPYTGAGSKSFVRCLLDGTGVDTDPAGLQDLLPSGVSDVPGEVDGQHFFCASVRAPSSGACVVLDGSCRNQVIYFFGTAPGTLDSVKNFIECFASVDPDPADSAIPFCPCPANDI